MVTFRNLSPIHVLSILDHIPFATLFFHLIFWLLSHGSYSCGNEGVAIFEGGTWSVRLCTLQSITILSYLTISHDSSGDLDLRVHSS